MSCVEKLLPDAGIRPVDVDSMVEDIFSTLIPTIEVLGEMWVKQPSYSLPIV